MSPPRISVESWDPDYGSPLAQLAPDKTDATIDAEVELTSKQWRPIAPPASTHPAREVLFIDGVRRIVGEVLHDIRLIYHGAGTAAITEGPRFETPAEVRALATLGAEIVTHTFAPEMFLARELQMCYAAMCYVTNYAEAGSQQPPLGGALFESMKPQTGTDRLAGVVESLGQIISNVAQAALESSTTCTCDQTQSQHIEQYGLPDDWHQWLGQN